MAGRFQVMNVPGWLMTVAVLMSLSIGRALAGEPATAVATITAGFFEEFDSKFMILSFSFFL